MTTEEQIASLEGQVRQALAERDEAKHSLSIYQAKIETIRRLSAEIRSAIGYA